MSLVFRVTKYTRATGRIALRSMYKKCMVIGIVRDFDGMRNADKDV